MNRILQFDIGRYGLTYTRGYLSLHRRAPSEVDAVYDWVRRLTWRSKDGWIWSELR